MYNINVIIVEEGHGFEKELEDTGEGGREREMGRNDTVIMYVSK